MIKTFRLERFKRFADLSLRMAPLTVLTGTNGAGKTTVVHSLLLARQAARLSRGVHVELNGVDSLALGEAAGLIHRQTGGEDVVIETTEDYRARWRLALPKDDRALHLVAAEIPVKSDGSPYDGVLAQSSPRFTYLCAERFGPRDVLGASSIEPSALGVGVHGEFTAQVLAAPRPGRVRPGRMAGTLAEEARLASLLHQTEAWMNTIVRPLQISAEWFPGTTVTRLQFKTPGIQSEWTRAPNMGFGVSYALPIVVAGLSVPEGGLLIVENPEAHLHPAGQSNMGAFLAQVAADGTQVLVETHSDHVLNGIRRSVATGRAALGPNDTAIHFFRGETDPGPVVESMQLQQTGQLSAWPAGFFDQTQRDLALLARAQLKKS